MSRETVSFALVWHIQLDGALEEAEAAEEHAAANHLGGVAEAAETAGELDAVRLLDSAAESSSATSWMGWLRRQDSRGYAHPSRT